MLVSLVHLLNLAMGNSRDQDVKCSKIIKFASHVVAFIITSSSLGFFCYSSLALWKINVVLVTAGEGYISFNACRRFCLEIEGGKVFSRGVQYI